GPLVGRTGPDTADLTSTFVTGPTTPTSRTEPCRSSAWTLPSRNGVLSALGSVLSLPLLAFMKATPPRARSTTRMPIHFFFFTRNPPKAEKGRATCPLYARGLNNVRGPEMLG